jgi:uncharacterized protein
MPRTVSPAVARRYLVLRHLLAPPRSLPAEPASVMRVFERLGSLQFDPIDVSGRNHDLALLARVKGYRREWTEQLLYGERALYETYNKGLSLVPTSELPWYRIAWDLSHKRHSASTFEVHAGLVKELLDRIQSTGPLASTDVEPREAIDWFWRPTNQVRAILEALALAGVLGLARRDGNRRVYDLVERLFPDELLNHRPALEEQARHKLLSRYRAHGLLGARASAETWLGTGPSARERALQRAALIEEGAILPVQVEGLRDLHHIPATDLPFLDEAEREIAAGIPPGGVAAQVAFLAPLDPIVWDRRLLRDLFGFDYLWEVYTPAAKRRWGYYVLPLLYGDRLVGRIEPRVDRKADVLHVLGLWWEEKFDPSVEAGLAGAVATALKAHREFAGVKKIRLPSRGRNARFLSLLRRSVLE